MKNITLSADERLIEQARLLAKSQHKTLNSMFREWLEQFTARSGGTQEFDALMKRLKHVQAGRHFSRDEMNEQAIEVVVREGRGSVSLLQRYLGVGYGRAARLIDYMAEDGIVGDYNGSQAREVLYTLEQWEALVAGEQLEESSA